VRFTWGWEIPERAVPPGSSTVAIELQPEGAGTRLRLSHTGLPPDWVEPHQQGWELYVGHLQDVAGRGGS
jgi:hypothetical protein